jgi:hypothetical protein
MSNVRTSAGTTIAVSASAPASYNLSGFVALTFSLIGEITNVGDFGKRFNKVEHKPIGPRRIVKRKGMYDNGALPLEIGRDYEDEGQVLLKAACETDDSYSYEVTLQCGSKYYFSAQAMDYILRVGEADNITGISCNLEIDNEIIESLPA